MEVELIIQNGDVVYYPEVKEGISWETSRQGAPGKLTFDVVQDEKLVIDEGNPVRLTIDGKGVFYGFIFIRKFDKDGIVSITAYDQLRYFKNKDSYIYKNKTASDLIRMLAEDFKLRTGSIDNTAYVIPSRVEDNSTLFDIIQNALDLTLQNKKRLYVLFDDFGKIALKDIENMKLNLLIDETSGESYSYESSIDGETYNKIKLTFDNSKKGKKEIFIAQDSKNINKWGVLQYFDTIKENTDGKKKADALLGLYNKKTRSLSLSNVLGDLRVRAGSSVGVVMKVGDIHVQNYMIVEKVTHNFNENEHFMDLTLRGGEFIA